MATVTVLLVMESKPEESIVASPPSATDVQPAVLLATKMLPPVMAVLPNVLPFILLTVGFG